MLMALWLHCLGLRNNHRGGKPRCIYSLTLFVRVMALFHGFVCFGYRELEEVIKRGDNIKLWL